MIFLNFNGEFYMLMLFINSLPNWLMAVGAVTSAIILIFTLKKQKEQFLQSRFEEHFFNMVQTFNNKIEGLYYTEKISNNNVIYNGAYIFKHLSLLYLTEIINKSSDLKKKDAAIRIKSTYHSNLKNLFDNLIFIYNYINQNFDVKSRNYYYEYLILNIPEYLKFIIALYKIYVKESIAAKILIKDIKILKELDFTSFITDDAEYDNFMAKVNE